MVEGHLPQSRKKSARVIWSLAYLTCAGAILWSGTHSATKAIFFAIAALMLIFFADQFSRKTVSAFQNYWWVLVLALIVMGAGGLINVAAITASALVGAVLVLFIVLAGLLIMLRPLLKSRNRDQYSRWNQTLSPSAERTLAWVSLVLASISLVLALAGF